MKSKMKIFLIICIYSLIIKGINNNDLIYDNFDKFLNDVKLFYIKNNENENIFELNNQNFNKFTKLEKIIFYNKILNEDFIWRSFIHLNGILEKNYFNDSLFLIFYGLLNKKSLDIYKLKNDEIFKNNLDFKNYIVKYIINKFLEKLLIKDEAIKENIIIFLENFTNEDYSKFDTYNSIIDFIVNIEYINSLVYKFNRFSNYFELNKKYNKNINFNFSINEDNANIDNNIFIILKNKKNLGKEINSGHNGSIYNFNNNVLKCNNIEVLNLTYLKEVYINKILNEECPDKVIKFYKLYYFTDSKLLCSEYEKGDYDLRYYYFNKFKSEVNIQVRNNIIMQINDCYSCLKKLNISHWNFRPKNLLIFEKNFNIKVIDFGNAIFEISSNKRSYIFNIINKIRHWYNYYQDLKIIFKMKTLFLYDINLLNKTLE